MNRCNFCDKIISNKGSLKSHELCCKWSQFPDMLMVWKKKEINIIQNFWADSQVAYDTGLLTRHSRNVIESSNLSLPAIYINGVLL